MIPHMTYFLTTHLRRTAPLLRVLAALALTTLTTVVLLQPSTRPLIGPPAPIGAPTLAREIALTAGHIAAFSSLVAVWTWALAARLPLTRAVVIAVAGALVYSPLTEWGQSFVPDRSASLYDLAVNAVTALATGWIINRLAHSYAPDGL